LEKTKKLRLRPWGLCSVALKESHTGKSNMVGERRKRGMEDIVEGNMGDEDTRPVRKKMKESKQEIYVDISGTRMLDKLDAVTNGKTRLETFDRIETEQ
jgi:hypothetical protein